jgi:hypothetical protein
MPGGKGQLRESDANYSNWVIEIRFGPTGDGAQRIGGLSSYGFGLES